MPGVRRVLIAIGAGLALADASVVTLALPPMLVDLDTTVEGVAAVIGVYTFVLAAALPGAAWLRPRVGDRTLGAAGFAVFALAGALCATPDAIETMLAFRVLQAVGAAGALVAAFVPGRTGRPDRSHRRRRRPGACRSTVARRRRVRHGGGARAGRRADAGVRLARDLHLAGPAGAGRGRRLPRGARPGRHRRRGAARGPAPGRVGAIVALAAVSAALTGVLFLLVLLLVSGWSIEPLAAAAAVSMLPVAAFAGARIPGDPAVRASAGCALVGGGVLALAALPEASIAWILAPQVLAGLGMGMAIPALAGELLPERTPGQAASLLSIRHAGITVALVLLAPVAAAQLDDAVVDVREQGAALILDAKLPPLDKIELAGPLLADLDPVDPRDSLRRALDAQAGRFADAPEQRREYAQLTQRADDALMDGIDSAFRIAFAIAGGLALIGAVAVLPRSARRGTVAVAAAGVALALPAVYAIVRPQVGPDPVVIADPCEDRDLPDTGGIDGFVQDQALRALDSAACRFGSSREELALALADDDHARAYERAHGVDPRSVGGLLEAIGIDIG